MTAVMIYAVITTIMWFVHITVKTETAEFISQSHISEMTCSTRKA